MKDKFNGITQMPELHALTIQQNIINDKNAELLFKLQERFEPNLLGTSIKAGLDRTVV